MTVVGVSRDVKHYGVDEEMRPGVYQPLRQLPLSGMALAVRTSAEPSSLADEVRALTAEIDVELPVFNVETMATTMSDSLWTRRAMSWLIAAFSGVALFLAIAGIYGVISYNVAHRTREIGIRMAMGAQGGQVRTQVLRQGMVMVGVGVLAGLALSIAGAGLVGGILVDVNARDPIVYSTVTLLLIGVAALANYLPARRAASLNPSNALRL